MSNQPASPVLRLRLVATGQVQGVGFRPFVYRLAHNLGLSGLVGNTSEGVLIEVQGPRKQVEAFPRRLGAELPPLAKLTALETTTVPPLADEKGFLIVQSHGHRGHHVLVSPDVGICPDCLADMRSPDNRRYRYPFTNCTNCGPRYTITRSIPYDRAVTSMACFPLCPDCAKEYQDPLDRRFHAQPIACPVCGPHVWFVEAGSETTTCPGHCDSLTAIGQAAAALLAGKIVALRGLGGFQLACDAGLEESVAQLRARKHRPHKSFALMARDLAAVETVCHADENALALLSSPARPAVILPRRQQDEQAGIAPSVAPDLSTLAVMLPTTPLHVVLFDLLAEQGAQQGRPVPILVMTSGNASGDPICLGNREALQRLATAADCFLLHDRDILCRVDDSVVLPLKGSNGPEALFFRRARGYVPSPVRLACASSSCVFGMGADLKATVCLTRDDLAFVGQHTGDLENVATAGFYEEVLTHLSGLLEVSPDLVVTDLHPDFHSTACGRDLARRFRVPCTALQHHAAHAAAVLAEHGVEEPALALVLDGFGLGTDGTMWGCELLSMDLGRAVWQRQGHLAPFALPGGDEAVRSPWRIACALADGNEKLLQRLSRGREREAMAVAQMLEKRLNSPLTSSCGRLFDAVSALLGVCQNITYEGQAAIRLETLALRALGTCPPMPRELAERVLHLLENVAGPLPNFFPQDAADTADDQVILQARACFSRAAALLEERVDVSLVALDFHACLCLGLAAMARARKGLTARGRIALGGGVVNNSLVRGLLCAFLQDNGFTVLVPGLVPPGDGGLSLGQAAYGLALLRNGRTEEGSATETRL